MPPATRSQLPPTSAAARPSISSAALRVNVRSRMCAGGTPHSTSRATRYTRVRVLPLPAPAITSTGPSTVVAARYWAAFSSLA